MSDSTGGSSREVKKKDSIHALSYGLIFAVLLFPITNGLNPDLFPVSLVMSSVLAVSGIATFCCERFKKDRWYSRFHVLTWGLVVVVSVYMLFLIFL